MVAIIDYDAGNIKSVQKAIELLGAEVVVTREKEILLKADKVILPGVGAFGDAMEKLRSYELEDVIKEIIKKGTPFLGICLGLQLLFEESEESPGVKGLGILEGKIVRFSEEHGLKIPHIGWNSLTYPSQGTLYKGIKVVGRIDNLEIILPQNKLDEIAIALPLKQYGRLASIVELCEKSGVHTKFIPDYNSFIPSKSYTEDLMGLPVINIRKVPLTDTSNMIIKRIMDFLGALFGIILISPLLLVIAILVKCTSKGPVIFKQERIGRQNKPFQMYKFRSMKLQTVEDEEKGWTVKDDPRVTKIGKFIRKTSLDELPQLFNILKGDMSLVGPRPERPQFVEKFKEEIPRYMIKHQVRPGLTGWAQVNGYRGDTSIRRRIDFDLYYIENWTMGFDFKIMFMTIFKGFINENAY